MPTPVWIGAGGGAEPVSHSRRLPAEWEPHAATWLAFPHHRTDFQGKLSALPFTFAEMARVLAPGERIKLLCRDERERDRAEKIFSRAGVALSQVDFLLQDTNRSWVRDYLPLWVQAGSNLEAVKFRFDGWSRYQDHQKDDGAGLAVARKHGPEMRPRLSGGELVVLEGGSIDVDGRGSLLTSEECLLSSPRARFLRCGGSLEERRELSERVMAEWLGAQHVIWLPSGIVGDDTSGHIDDFARFAPGGRVLVGHEPNPSDPNHAPLLAAQEILGQARDADGRPLEVIQLPMPQPVYYDGERLPASYANFYVANAAVIVPVFNDPADRRALDLIAHCFPDRPTVGIYARDLVVGLGTLHCSTMQQPNRPEK